MKNIIANGFEKSSLHQRIAIKTILFLGHFMFSNTATCLLMLITIKFSNGFIFFCLFFFKMATPIGR